MSPLTGKMPMNVDGGDASSKMISGERKPKDDTEFLETGENMAFESENYAEHSNDNIRQPQFSEYDQNPRINVTKEAGVPIYRRRSKSSNAILCQIDENALENDVNAKLESKDNRFEVLELKKKINNELLKLKSNIHEEKDVLKQQIQQVLLNISAIGTDGEVDCNTIATTESKERDLMLTELMKLQNALQDSDLTNARQAEQLEQGLKHVQMMEQEINDLAQRYEVLLKENLELKRIGNSYNEYSKDRSEDAMEQMGVKGTLQDSMLSPTSRVDQILDGMKDNQGREIQDFDEMKAYTVELAEESDRALYAAVETAASEILKLERTLHDVRQENSILQKQIDLTDNKSLPIKLATNELIEAGSALAFDASIVHELLNRGKAVGKTDKNPSKKSEIATQLLKKHSLLVEAIDAQRNLMVSSQGLVDGLHKLLGALERHNCGISEEMFVKKFMHKLKISATIPLEFDTTEMNDVKKIEDVVASLNSALTYDNVSNVLQQKNLQIENLQMQVEASDLILRSALHAQSCQFEAMKTQLQNHTIEVQREAMKEIRKLEEFVCEMKANNGLKSDKDSNDPSKTSRTSPLSLEFPNSRNSSYTSISSDESPTTLRDRLMKEKRLRKIEERRHNLISEERTVTITELLATIKRLKLKDQTDVVKSQSFSSGSVNVNVVKKALQTVSSEIVNIRHSLNDE